MKELKKYLWKLAYAIISKSFIVFIIATVLKWNGKIGEWAWIVAALGFISVNLLKKVLVKTPDIMSGDIEDTKIGGLHE